jgi:DNA-directed RNA polymerase specialized sigma24 family protein
VVTGDGEIPDQDRSQFRELQRIAAIEDPHAQLRAVTRRFAELQQVVEGLAQLRRDVVEQLHAQGLSYSQIASAAGLSRGRIGELRGHASTSPAGEDAAAR